MKGNALLVSIRIYQPVIACHRSKPADNVTEVCKIMCIVFSPYQYFTSFGCSYRYVYHILKASMLPIYRCIGPLLICINRAMIGVVTEDQLVWNKRTGTL